MLIRPSVLCPIDFSEASRGALRHAAALAEHFFAELTVLTVDDPLLTEAASAALGADWMAHDTRHALERFVADTFEARTRQLAAMHLCVRVGQPAAEILRAAGETHADLIVMSTHGLSGVRKVMFGSVTERVLRETTVPVIVSPASDAGPDTVETWKGSLRRILVPVDFGPWTPQQVRIARGLAEALDSRLLFAHVLEPLRRRPGHGAWAEGADATRRDRVHRQLGALIESVPPRLRPTMTIATGDPASELARIAREFETTAAVIGLHAAPEKHQRMGTVTYRLLCQTAMLVIAWPPSAPDHLTAQPPLEVSQTRA